MTTTTTSAAAGRARSSGSECDLRAARVAPATTTTGRAARWLRALPIAALLLGAVAPPARADMLVSGDFQYVDRAFSYDGWTGEWPERPVRLVRVVVVDTADGSLLAEGLTDLDGHFAIPVSGSGTADLAVRALSECQVLGPPSVKVASLDGQVYSLSSPVYGGWDLDADLDVGLSVSEVMLSGIQKGNPFNVLDTIVDGFRYVAAAGLPPSTEPLDVCWPIPGNDTAGSLAKLWIGTGNGYDDVVVLHELGHSMDFRYSNPSTPAGDHTFGQSDQNPALSLSEGFATWFAGAVRQWKGDPNPGFYFDGSGSNTTGLASVLLRADFETRAPFKGKTSGEADEVAVFAALWNVTDTAATDDGDLIDDDPVDGSYLFGGRYTGDQFVLQAMRGESMFAASSVHVIKLWDAFFADLHADDRFDDLALCFEESKIAVRSDAAEPDDTPEQALPVVPDSGWGPTRTLVAGRQWPPVPGDGDQDQIVFELPAQVLFEVETRYPKGKSDAETYADTYLKVFDGQGTSLGFADGGGEGRNARVLAASGAAGSYRALVQSFNSTRPTGSYEVRVRVLGPLESPTLAAVSPLELVSVSDGYLGSLSLTGEHFIGVQSVTVGGVPSSFTASSDTTLVVSPPLAQQLGPQQVVVANAVGQDELGITITAPDPPAVNVNAGSLFWSYDPVRVLLGSEPHDVVYLFLSLSNQPTSIPGVVDLAIGAAGDDLLLLDVVELGEGGTSELEFRRPANLVGVTNVWVQGAVERSAGPPLPLVPTNVEPGVLFP